MTQKVKGCIFDLDGVICNTAEYHFLAWKDLADRLGIPFTKQDNERLKGVSRMESLKILLSFGSGSYSEEEKKSLAGEKNKRYIQYISQIDQSELLPGVKRLLAELRQARIKISFETP